MTEKSSKAKAESEASTADTTPPDQITEDSATPEKGGVKASGPIGEVETTTAADDGKVEVVLAHPITRDADKVRLGLKPEDKCNVHDKIKVTRDDALRLINAGMIQVDPEDAQAVREAVNG